MAAAGHLADGYRVLLLGRRRAEALQRSGVPWAAALVARWQQACTNYCLAYGVSIPD
jgi:hypothetical protein